MPKFNPGDHVRRRNVPAKPTQEEITRASTKLVTAGFGADTTDYRETGVILGYNDRLKRYVVKMDEGGNNMSIAEDDIQLILS